MQSAYTMCCDFTQWNTDEHCHNLGLIMQLIWNSLWIWYIQKHFADVNFLWPLPPLPPHSIVWPSLRNHGLKDKNELGLNRKEETMSQMSNRKMSLATLCGHIPAHLWTYLLFQGVGWCFLFVFLSPLVLILLARIINECPRMTKSKSCRSQHTKRGEWAILERSAVVSKQSAFKSNFSEWFFPHLHDGKFTLVPNNWFS